MSNAYEFVKETIAKTKAATKEEKLAKLDEFVKISMEMNNKNYPDWYVGKAIILGNRYDKLEMPHEGGYVPVYVDCEEFHQWLRTNYKNVPHYLKHKDLFFEQGNYYSDIFFKFYRMLNINYERTNEDLLEEVVEGWKKKYGNMTEVDLFLEAKNLRYYMKNSKYTRSYYNVNHTIDKNKAMEKLLDIFYYCIYYKYDIYMSVCNPKSINYKVSAADIDASSYMYGQQSSLSLCVFEGGESYYYNDSHLKELFPVEIAHPPDDIACFKFPLPDGYIAYDAENDFEKLSFVKDGEPTIEDALKVFDIDLHDFPNMNLSGGRGIAVLFKRTGEPTLVYLDDLYCDEVWE